MHTVASSLTGTSGTRQPWVHQPCLTYAKGGWASKVPQLQEPQLGQHACMRSPSFEKVLSCRFARSDSSRCSQWITDTLASSCCTYAGM